LVSEGNNSLAVLFGKSNGTLYKTIIHCIGKCPTFVVFADRSDGKLEVMVSNFGYADNPGTRLEYC
jgi:hypothetical protein